MHASLRWSSLALVTLAAVLNGAAAEPERPRGESASPGEPLSAAGIENLYRLTPRVYSGGEPQGPEGFAALRALGVRTILSVDGAATDVDAARRYGLRYVHLPIGYDGIDGPQALRIVKAAQSLPGPVFLHCHHGKHRGPAAAAVVCLATQQWDRGRALSWLHQAGTSPDYPGLFRTVREFQPPTATALAALPAEFPERAAVPDLIETMVEIDRLWERLTALRKAGWTASGEHPDLDPPHAARLLAEQFRELVRRDETASRGEAFPRELADAEAAAGRLEAALRTPVHLHAAERAYAAVQQSCKTCHRAYRDRGTAP